MDPKHTDTHGCPLQLEALHSNNIGFGPVLIVGDLGNVSHPLRFFTLPVINLHNFESFTSPDERLIEDRISESALKLRSAIESTGHSLYRCSVYLQSLSAGDWWMGMRGTLPSWALGSRGNVKVTFCPRVMYSNDDNDNIISNRGSHLSFVIYKQVNWGTQMQRRVCHEHPSLRSKSHC